jgi:predicted TIM-barrel fold metal-dependent hydrolase
MVKTFPNVYFNLCWIVQFSNILYKNIIKKLLSIVPINKIFGFGGDYLFAEGTYGAQVLARKCLADVLYEKIVEDNLSLEDAKQISDFLFFDNAYKVFKPGLKSS